MKKRPLEGIRVVDFTHVLSGPVAGSMLADLGAEVIKVEKVSGGDSTRQMGPPFQQDQTAFFQSVNRGKRGLAVSLKDPRGLAAVKKLIESADVLLENFRPGVMKKLGLGYENVKAMNPAIIYASMTAYGYEGPYKDYPGYELIVQALTGMVDLQSGADGTPRKAQPQLVDLGTGVIMSVGVLAALFHRQCTGQGQWVKGNLLHSAAMLMCNFYSKYGIDGSMPPRGLDTRSDFITPSQAYKTADGYFVTVTPGRQWARFCTALNRPEWADDPDYSNAAWRKNNVNRLEEEIQAITTKQTTGYWLIRFKECDVPIARVNTLGEFMDQDPQAKALGIFREVSHPELGLVRGLVSPPWEFSETPCDTITPPPMLGEHSNEILQGLGYPPEEILALREAKVIA